MNRILSMTGITFLLLSSAAFLEALGDLCFQSALHRCSGCGRILRVVLGTVILGLYGLLVNGPHWDFGRLLSVYVILFFLAAQIIARLRFNQLVPLPVSVGGVLIEGGGLIVTFWKG